MRNRRLTKNEIDLFIDYLDARIKILEAMDKTQNKHLADMIIGIKSIRTDLVIERKRRFEINEG